MNPTVMNPTMAMSDARVDMSHLHAGNAVKVARATINQLIATLENMQWK